MNSNNSIRFLHYRDFGPDGKPLPTGGVTYVMRKVEDGKVEIAAALCRNKRFQQDRKHAYSDNFCRRTGRDIALGRLLAGKGEALNVEAGNEYKAAAEQLDAIAGSFGYYRHMKGCTVLSVDLSNDTFQTVTVPAA